MTNTSWLLWATTVASVVASSYQNLSATYEDGILKVLNTQETATSIIGKYTTADAFAADLMRMAPDAQMRAHLIREVCFLPAIEALGKDVLQALESEAVEILQTLSHSNEKITSETSSRANNLYGQLVDLLPTVQETFQLTNAAGIEKIGDKVSLTFIYQWYTVVYTMGHHGHDDIHISSCDDEATSFDIQIASINSITTIKDEVDTFIDAMNSYRQFFPNDTSSASLPVHKDWVQGRWQYTVRGKGMHSIRIWNN